MLYRLDAHTAREAGLLGLCARLLEHPHYETAARWLTYYAFPEKDLAKSAELRARFANGLDEDAVATVVYESGKRVRPVAAKRTPGSSHTVNGWRARSGNTLCFVSSWNSTTATYLRRCWRSRGGPRRTRWTRSLGRIWRPAIGTWRPSRPLWRCSRRHRASERADSRGPVQRRLVRRGEAWPTGTIFADC
jgi:hypothetical protein